MTLARAGARTQPACGCGPGWSLTSSYSLLVVLLPLSDETSVAA
jgi:hypothetical protein